MVITTATLGSAGTMQDVMNTTVVITRTLYYRNFMNTKAE